MRINSFEISFFLITLLILSSHVNKGLGQSNTVPYLHWNTESGLPSNEIYHIIESCNGKIWIATDNGVVNYNGKEFKTFNRKDGLTDNVVFKLFEDEKGVIWCTTLNNEICQILPNDSIIPYKWNDTLAKWLPKSNSPSYLAISLAVTHDTLAIGYRGKGGFQIDPSGNCQFISNTPGEYRVQKFGKNSIQFSTPQKTKHIIFNDHKLTTSEIDGLTMKNIFYGYSCRLNNGNLVGTYANVAFIENDTGIETLPFPEPIIYITQIEDLLWIGTQNNGAYAYKLEHGTWVKKHHLFQGNSISTIFKDQNNGYWFATHESGIYYLLDFSYQRVEICNETNNIYDTKLLGDDIFIMASEYHIYAYNKDSLLLVQKIDTNFAGVFFYYYDESYNDKYLYTLFKDDSHLKLNERTASIIGPLEKKLCYVKFLSQDKSISVTYQEQITLMNHKLNTSFSIDGKFATSKAMVFDSLLVTTGGNGCSIYQIYKDSIEFIGRYSISEPIKYIKHYPSGLYCSSSSGVIYKYSSANNTFEKFFSLEDLGFSDFEIVDDQIWLATNSGLIKSEDNTLEKYWEEPVKSVFIEDSNVIFTTNKALFKFKNYDRIDNSSFFIKSYSVNGLETAKTEFSNTENNFKFSIGVSHPVPEKEHELQAVLVGKDTFITNLYGMEVSYPQLSPGKYQFYVINLSNNSQSEVFFFTIHGPIWQELWFISVVFFSFLLIIFLIVFNYYKRREKRIQLHNDLIELQSKALRAQMNPHFIFNVMNVIQSLISSKKLDESSTVLVRLSKLIRSALNYSKNETITLEEELEFCQNYFDLENLRVNNRMKLIINLASGVNANQINIPPLTLQPIIENAIIHGLLPKKEDGQIKIDIEIIDSVLHISIRDNGIGIENSASKPGHQSHGLDMVSQRITILDKRNSVRFEPDPNSEGTTVKLSIYL